jgi:hypothetical protein
MNVTVFVAAVLLIAGAPLFGWAQGLPAFSPEIGVTSPLISSLPSIPGLGSFNIGALKVIPSVRAGYQSIAMNINFPIVPDNVPNTNLDLRPLDLTLNDARVWVGFLGLDTWFNPNFNLFLQLGGNAKRLTTVSTTGLRVRNLPNDPNRRPDEWTGRNLEWWMIEGRVGYRFVRDAIFCLGWKWDHFMLDLTDPRNRNDRALVRGDILSYTGDMSVNGSMPYFGFVFGQPNYYASLIFSPLATCDVQIPFDIVAFANASGSRLRYNEARYTFNKKGGYFVEGNMEYNFNAMAGLDFGLWIKGSLMRVGKDGQEQLNAYRNNPVSQIQSALGTADSTFVSYLLSAGISAELAF